LRLIGVSFYVLAGYVTVQAVFDLAGRSEPEASTVGIVLAAVSLVVMPTLAALKRRKGRRLGSNSVVADSRQTMLCTYLSAVLLIGLLLNATVVWWWADRWPRSSSLHSRSTRAARRGMASGAATMTIALPDRTQNCSVSRWLDRG
jgi:Cation efflux family